MHQGTPRVLLFHETHLASQANTRQLQPTRPVLAYSNTNACKSAEIAVSEGAPL